MKIKYYLKKVDGLVVPSKANITDAGYDVIATSDPKIVGVKWDSSFSRTWPTIIHQTGEPYYSIDYVEYETNLYFIPETNYIHTDLRPRSSISSQTNFVLANSVGLIDSEYHNQVLARFKYIWQPCDLIVDTGPFATMLYWVPNLGKMYKKGDKIAQLLSVESNSMTFEIVDELPGENRGGGFGSTGK